MDFASSYAYLSTNVEEIDDADMHTPLAAQQSQIRSHLQPSAAPAAPTTVPFPNPPELQLIASLVENAVAWVKGVTQCAPPPPPPPPKPTKKRFQRQIDTNIVTIPLGKLKDEVHLATGDCEFCKQKETLRQHKTQTNK